MGIAMIEIPSTPRKLDCVKTFNSIVSWIEETARKERAPGLIVGISGTDSILTFLACAKAFENLGKPDRVLGLNFEHTSKNEFAGKGQAFECAKTSGNWVKEEIFPWLKTVAPHAKLEVDDTIPHSDENVRWGHLFSRSVKETNARQGLVSEHYFPVGTRNATEQALGTYSQISKSVSLLPIINLFKSEVLELCEFLGVPQIAIDKSREIDCDCGRFDVQANHMRELDLFIMARQNLLSKEFVKQAMPQDVYAAVMEFYAEETDLNAYRPRTPYLPEHNLTIIG